MPRFLEKILTAKQWTIYADNARPEIISYLSRNGFDIKPCDKWKGSVEDGIAYIKGFKQIYVHPRCVNTSKEFRMYSYKVDKRSGEILPVLEDKMNHAIDALRYALNPYIKSDDWTAIYERLGA